jgi:hypothetical protein
MARETEYEFVSYGEDAGGPQAIERHTLASESSARSKAGSIAKKINGPVDIAVAGAENWDQRYVTTASPSEFHTSGYRFERLD